MNLSLSLSLTISISFIKRQIVPRSAAWRRRSTVYPLPSQRIKARSVSIPGKRGSLPRPSRPCVAEIRFYLSNSTGMTKPSATSNASDVGSVVDQSGRGLMQHSHVTKDWNYHTQMSTEQWKLRRGRENQPKIARLASFVTATYWSSSIRRQFEALGEVWTCWVSPQSNFQHIAAKGGS